MLQVSNAVVSAIDAGHRSSSQQTFTSSKSTIETLEKRCEICSKSTVKTLERRQGRHSGVFIVNFELILQLFLVFLLLNLSLCLFAG